MFMFGIFNKPDDFVLINLMSTVIKKSIGKGVSIAVQLLVLLCVVQSQDVFADSPVEATNRIVNAEKQIDTAEGYENLSRTGKAMLKAKNRRISKERV